MALLSFQGIAAVMQFTFETSLDLGQPRRRCLTSRRHFSKQSVAIVVIAISWLSITTCNTSSYAAAAANFRDDSSVRLPPKVKTGISTGAKRKEPSPPDNKEEAFSVEKDSTSFKQLQLFGRKELLPSLNDFWKRGQTYGWDLVDRLHRSRRHGQSQSQQQHSPPRSTDALEEADWTNTTSDLAVNPNATVSWLDGLARSFVVSVGCISGVQTLNTWISNVLVFDDLASRWLGAESTAAIKTIREILSNAQDHGLVDVITKYPPSDVAASIYALSRLQQAAVYYNDTWSNPPKEDDNNNDDEWDDDLMNELAHYAKFASAAYGWAMDLAFSGRIHLGDLQALLKLTGIARDDVVSSQWQSRTHHPAYFIVRERERKRIVLCIRGTWSLRDILTDLCCIAQEFETAGKTRRKHRAHHGMLEAARSVASTAQEIIQAELDSHPDYSLVLVGHSMGGGVAALLGILWEDVFPGKLAAYAYGAPCVTPLNSTLDDFPSTIVSVVTQGDPMSFLSLGHIADVSIAVSKLCEEKELRQEILSKTDTSVEKMKESDLSWCSDTMTSLREGMICDRFYPPGRILLLSQLRNGQTTAVDNQLDQKERKANGRKPDLSITSRFVPPEFFRDLVIGPRMFDLSQHVPSRYESWLRRLIQQKSTAVTAA